MKCYHGCIMITVALQDDPLNINCFPTDIHKVDEVTFVLEKAGCGLVQNTLFCHFLEISIYKITIFLQFVVMWIIQTCSLYLG